MIYKSMMTVKKALNTMMQRVRGGYKYERIELASHRFTHTVYSCCRYILDLVKKLQVTKADNAVPISELQENCRPPPNVEHRDFLYCHRLWIVGCWHSKVNFINAVSIPSQRTILWSPKREAKWLCRILLTDQQWVD